MTWDPDIAATSFPFRIGPVVWSPCNNFIAIGAHDIMRVDILDSATLQRLQTLESPRGMRGTPIRLIFPLDMKMLTWLGRADDDPSSGWVDASNSFIISWDLQTGGVVSIIKVREGLAVAGIAFSTRRKMVAVLCPPSPREYRPGFTIAIYNVVSGVYMHNAYHSTTPLCDIWTHGESLRMATAEPKTITIREVGFTPGATCVEVGILSIPENVNHNLGHMQAQFLPTSYRLALICDHWPIRKVLVWCLRDSKSLLYHIDIDSGTPVTFSSDDRLFSYATRSAEVYIWKETSTGYTPHAKIPAINTPYLSPSGESFVTVGNSAIQLWDVKKIATTPSDLPTEASYHTKDFLLDFFLDRPLAVFVRRREGVAMVLDLESGLPQLTIQTSLRVHGLRVIGDTIVVISEERAIAWRLPGGKKIPDGRVGVEHSAQKINLSADDRAIGSVTAASISLDLRYIAILRDTALGCALYLHDASSGHLLTCKPLWWKGGPLSFTPDGLGICFFHRGGGAKVVKITGDDLIMTPATDIEAGLLGCPWGTPGGYQVTDDGWILGADRKRLLMLPPPWQSRANNRFWNGRFLALLHSSLPEPVILELEP